ncbi:unnamed protein product [Prunus armeniaca]|uniref:Uncharacterized protein n=1 Tax=Prunus armeniaca TaxID=36596 RepID=A0A6J5X8K7_PRUAR|nr:unnamed protein product [Prunus armeniaca]
MASKGESVDYVYYAPIPSDPTHTQSQQTIIHDVFYLLEALARGVIPFDTDTEVEGTLGLSFFKIPIKPEIACWLAG